MANPNTKPEEQQPLTPPAPYQPSTYAPPTPTAQYEGSALYDEIQRQINEWATKTDPQRQAEEDAKIQRGRQFWTGANLFANVIANAINASGTAKGAPSMIFNDAASQKMYDTWQQQDKELKADRRAAQQRIDALTMQDASLRHADKQAADKAALDVYNRNYEAGEKANQARYAAEMDEFKYQRGKQDAAEKTAAENAEWNRRQSVQNYYDKLKNERSIALKQAAKGYNEKQRTQIIGGTEFEATSEARAQGLVAQVYGQMLKRLNTDENGKERLSTDPKYMAFNKDNDYQYSFVNAYVDEMAASDPEFAKWFDGFSKKYGKKAAGTAKDPNDFFKS